MSTSSARVYLCGSQILTNLRLDARLSARMGAAGRFAGLAVWAVMVPEGMAYAGIVGVPPIMGLYTIVPPLIAYALLGTSRLLVVGPDTATGLISALTVGAVAAQGTADFNALTSTLAS